MLQAKRQRYRAIRRSGAGRKVRKDYEGCDPDSDQSFTLAALDSQSFIRKITLRIIPAAVSHNGTELQFRTLSLSSENLFHFKRGQTKYSIKPALLYQAPTILGRHNIKRLPERLFLLHHEQGW